MIWDSQLCLYSKIAHIYMYIYFKVFDIINPQNHLKLAPFLKVIIWHNFEFLGYYFIHISFFDLQSIFALYFPRKLSISPRVSHKKEMSTVYF